LLPFINKKDSMHIFVGSTNPIKVNSVTNAATETWPDVKVRGLDVPSGIPDQPYGDEQTKEGAQNRAERALERGLIELDSQQSDEDQVLGIGMEGGVFDYHNELWSTVWVAVVDVDGNQHLANGARFKVPEQIAIPMQKGVEMGDIVDKLFHQKDVRQKEGAIGVITENFIDRTEEYTGIAKLALGLWYGRNWHANLVGKEAQPELPESK
jgi:inosine/xanthosine triphosphatase